MKVKTVMVLLLSSMLLIGVLGGCATYSTSVPIKYSKDPGDDSYCYTHGYYNYYKDRDKHGGDRCQKRVATTSSYVGTTSIGLPSALPPKDVTAVRSVCGGCGYSANSCRCEKGGFTLFGIRIGGGLGRRGYWPTQRKVNNAINKFTGGPLQYLDSNWGWNSGSNRNNRVVFVGRYPMRGSYGRVVGGGTR